MKKLIIVTILTILSVSACSNEPIPEVDEEDIEPEKTPMDPVDPEPDYLWPEPGQGQLPSGDQTSESEVPSNPKPFVPGIEY